MAEKISAQCVLEQKEFEKSVLASVKTLETEKQKTKGWFSFPDFVIIPALGAVVSYCNNLLSAGGEAAKARTKRGFLLAYKAIGNAFKDDPDFQCPERPGRV